MNNNKLLGFTVYLTNDCNLRCSHCWVSGGKKTDYLSFDIIIKRIEEAYSLGVRNFLLTGGEPFMHPNIMDVIEHIAKKEDAYLAIETNATLIDDYQIDIMRNYENISLFASIDAATSEKHDLIRGVQGAFAITTETVLKLTKYELLKQCIMAVSKLNCMEIEDTIRLCIKLGVKILRILPVQPCGRGENLAKDSITFSVEEQIEFYKNQQDLMEKYYGQILVRTPIPPAFLKLKNVKNYQNECSFCNRLTLLPNGKYSMCGIGEAHQEYQFGEECKTSVYDCWNNDERVTRILDNTAKVYKMPCQVCIYKNICKGFCHAVSIQYSDTDSDRYRFCYEAYKQGLFPTNILIKS